MASRGFASAVLAGGLRRGSAVADYLNGGLGRRYPVTGKHSRGDRKLECSGGFRNKDVRECRLMGRRPLPVDYLYAGAGAFLRSPDQLEVIADRPLEVRWTLLPLYYESDIELLVHSDHIRSLDPDDILGRGLENGHEQKSRNAKHSLHIHAFTNSSLSDGISAEPPSPC